jgi:acyl-coenzyme A synthetase/AMP-(fatty) acid ligase
MKKINFLFPSKKTNNLAVISDNGIKLTYLELQKYSEDIYKYVNERCLVFCLTKNSIGSFCGYFSFLKNKVVPLMLDVKIDFELLEKLISIYKPEYLWLPTNNTSEFSSEKIIYSIFDYSLIKLNNQCKTQLNDDLALLLTTSGSTGSPKLVKLSYENIKENAKSIIEYLSINESERPITTLPMNYSFGLSIINSHLIKGATILLTSKSLMEKGFWTFLKDQEATSISGVPYTYEMLKKLRFFRMDLPSLKTLTQAGGKLNNELNKELSKYCLQTNKRFFVMYGQTEATARMSYLSPEYSLTKLGSMGIAIPGGQFNLIDNKGNTIIENNIVGELVYKGANVSMGYAGCSNDLFKGDENRGKLITGDMAKRDDDGFYYIVGRKKRFVKIFGNRVNLDEIERLLKNKIFDCACIGDDDQIVIYIIDEAQEDEVRNFISLKTGIHHSAFTIKYIDEIPKNLSGKTIYSRLTL